MHLAYNDIATFSTIRMYHDRLALSFEEEKPFEKGFPIDSDCDVGDYQRPHK